MVFTRSKTIADAPCGGKDPSESSSRPPARKKRSAASSSIPPASENAPAASSKPATSNKKQRAVSAKSKSPARAVSAKSKSPARAVSSTSESPARAVPAKSKPPVFPSCISSEDKQRILAVLAGGHAGFLAFAQLNQAFYQKLNGMQCPLEKSTYCAAMATAVTPQFANELLKHHSHGADDNDILTMFDIVDYCRRLERHGVVVGESEVNDDQMSC